MRTKITVQDIADALNLSRTTVSKVLNHSPAVSEATRAMVLNKARELGYHTWNQTAASPAESVPDTDISHFALVMHAIPGGNHIGTIVIPSIDQRLRQMGYSLVTCTISDREYQEMRLPPILSHSQTKAIVCLEMFHPEYSRLLCTLGKPVLFIDACTDFFRLGLNADLLLMENRHSTQNMLTSVIKKHNVTTMGFFGDENHCVSFRERYEAFLLTAAQQQTKIRDYCIIDDDALYGDVNWVQSKLEAMEELPQLFFCANDFLAHALIQALETMGKQVPRDVLVCGFDGVGSISWPLNQLTTVVTPTSQLGTCAANILLMKLTLQDTVPNTTYLKTAVLFRESAP